MTTFIKQYRLLIPRSLALGLVIGLTAMMGCSTTSNSMRPARRSLDDILLETMNASHPKKPVRKSAQRDLADRPDPVQNVRTVSYQSASPSGPLVSEIFEETDIREAIQSLTSQSGVGVIVDDAVGGIVTAELEDVPFEQALDRILLPLGYIWGRKDGQYLIGSTDPSTALFRYLSVKLDYQPLHFAPEDLQPLLPEALQQYVRSVAKRNLLVVHAPRELADEIINELKHADRPVPQVVLEAIVTVHSPEESYQFGMDLQQLMDDGARQRNLGLNGLALSGSLTPARIGDLFGDFGTTSYFLRCLEQEGYLDITASPRVMAKDGEKAQISINRETFFATQPNTGDVFFRQDIEKVESGIVLDITPIIRGDTVTVKIERAEVSEDIRESGTGPDLASPYPLINRRMVTTTVDVKDGETITIGGLTHRQMVDRENRVPFLGSLPGIGKAFRQVDKQNEEAEVTVFISPRIVYPNWSDATPSVDGLAAPIVERP